MLPHCTNKNSLIAVKSDNAINYFEFTNEKDIPFYHRSSSKGFSMFCTDEEVEVINTRNKEVNAVLFKDSFLSTNGIVNEVMKMPQPKDERCYCLLCNKRFDKYEVHVQCEEHIKKVDNDVMRKINNAFTRVRLFWVGKEEKKEIINVNEDNNNNNNNSASGNSKLTTPTTTKKIKLNVEAYKHSYHKQSKETTTSITTKRIVPVNNTNSVVDDNTPTYLNHKRLSSRIIPIHSALN